ncbi:rhodanese-related sulfurtransferase [Legionella oakridgensis]|uniref:tRNA uridine(34) hydroxylase n=2 Tax=Legionella oakridgensis TaxID=29423 RepID=W0BCR8_9GAMM|nr:rhodanese-related sulfurtransferase [Legionella oakridgensis]AHE67665.1 putative sulfurtransferase [Legionella oakridgensis ATCC 33761 = DSM 21215]ETO92761.1 putative sulfurtransferase [Legionella oakridgensis RV-2-2007]KTD37000.1 sulfur transferase [Legionella oakridgensis]STY20691.1 rhodanese domain protein [Legionella longbeachae]
MKKYVIASFYKFVELTEFESLKKPLLHVMNTHHLLGTIILAHEGINGSVAGTRDEIEHLYHYLRNDNRFHDLWFKETYDDFLPFAKAKIKFRKEIVTMGVEGVSPLHSSGTHVSPDDWNHLISDPNVLVIDTRNDYEVNLGTFKHAINPHTDNFREFPEYVKTHLMDKKDKKIAMFCTGGIRCEKSTAYLKDLGFQDVYQLDGGILNYLDSIPEQESFWEGTCFVFDDRIAIEK